MKTTIRKIRHQSDKRLMTLTTKIHITYRTTQNVQRDTHDLALALVLKVGVRSHYNDIILWCPLVDTSPGCTYLIPLKKFLFLFRIDKRQACKILIYFLTGPASHEKLKAKYFFSLTHYARKGQSYC